MKPNIALCTGLLALGLMTQLNHASAQDSKKKPVAKPRPHTTQAPPSGPGKKMPNGFMRMDDGLEYKIVEHGNGKRKAQLGDHIELNISYSVGDSSIFDSRKMNNNKPVPIPVAASRGKGDPVEVFMQMVAGDSAVVTFPIDSMPGNQRPPWAKAGDMVTYRIRLVTVKSEAEDKKENEEKSKQQLSIDDKILQDYLKANNLKATKTPSGLYYSIQEEGHGEPVKKGYTATVNYTGMFINGKKFDSNTDSSFHHMQPFPVEVGTGHVIKGWDEGLMLLKPGSKAKLFIPSGLAYGSQDRGPQIPANSILIFDVEILSSKSPEEVKVEMIQKQKEAEANVGKQAEIDDKLLQEYFAKNNLHPTKTASGLYYDIKQKGLGDFAKPGKKVTMNYTGKLLDGTAFDSNTDPAFSHVQPFSFELGKGMVIKGWDEGVQLLKLGSKGTFYIPSGLAYGPRPSGKIPANSVLIFDVEVTGIDK